MQNLFNAFNIFECRRKLLDRLDVSYERAYMANPKEEYFKEMLDQLNEYNELHGKQLSSKKHQVAVLRVMEK